MRHTRPFSVSLTYSDPSGPTATPPGRKRASAGDVNSVAAREAVGEDLVAAGGMPFASNGTKVTL